MKPELDPWVRDCFAHPVTKEPSDPDLFRRDDGAVDARVFLRNTLGFSEWGTGQTEYERWERAGEGYANSVKAYREEIERDRRTYEHIRMSGRILDVGGGVGTVREFLSTDVQFASVDPFIDCLGSVTAAKREAYSCLSRPLNFVAGCAEFLPFRSGSFDWVHMRSMIDHLQVPDLALLEGHRILAGGGKLVIGLSIVGGPDGRPSASELAKSFVKAVSGALKIARFTDHHMFHPTFANLRKLVVDNKFEIDDVYWQPEYGGRVVYIVAKKQP